MSAPSLSSLYADPPRPGNSEAAGASAAAAPSPAPAAAVKPTRAQIQLGADDPGIAFQWGEGETRAWLGLAGNASYLTLLDERQAVRGQLAMSGDGPRITLADERRRARAQVRLGAEGPGIALLDEGGEMRAWLGLAADSSYLGLVDGGGNVRGRLSLAGTTPALVFSDEQRRARARLGMFADGPGIAFLGEDGETRAWLGVGAERTWFRLLGASGGPRVELVVGGLDEGAAYLALSDEQGRCRARARAGNGGPGLELLNAAGEMVCRVDAATLGLWQHGRVLKGHLGLGANGPDLRLFDGRGLQAAALEAGGGLARVLWAREPGQAGLELRLGAGEPELAFTRNEGGEGGAAAPRALALTLRQERPALEICDGSGATRIALASGEDQRRLELLDAAGRPRARARYGRAESRTGAPVGGEAGAEAAAAESGTAEAGMALLDAAGATQAWVSAPAAAMGLGALRPGRWRGELSASDNGPVLTLTPAAVEGTGDGQDAANGAKLVIALTAAGEASVAVQEGGPAPRPWLRSRGGAPRLVLWARERECGELEVGEEGAALTLSDAAGRARAQLRTRDLGAGIALLTETGETGAWFGITTDPGSYLGLLRNGGGVTGELAETAAELGQAAATSLRLLDASGQSRAELSVGEGGPRLILAAGNRRARAQIRLGPEGPGIAFLGAQGEPQGWLDLESEPLPAATPAAAKIAPKP